MKELEEEVAILQAKIADLELKVTILEGDKELASLETKWPRPIERAFIRAEEKGAREMAEIWLKHINFAPDGTLESMMQLWKEKYGK